MNRMLKRRNKKLLSRKKYQELFEFPVYKYYEKVGFNFMKKDDGSVVCDKTIDHGDYDW